MFVDHHSVTAHPGSPQEFSVDASDLQLPPGSWPSLLETNLGNELPLVLESLTEYCAVYHQSLGLVKLTVWND